MIQELLTIIFIKVFLFWGEEEEIANLSSHIKETYTKSKGFNSLWKYFGIKQTGEFSPGSATTDDKLDFIIQKISNEKVIVDFHELAFSTLNGSEKQILIYISEGKTNREIATALVLGEGTVRNYVSSIFSKLGVNNRAEATAFAIENGLKNYL